MPTTASNALCTPLAAFEAAGAIAVAEYSEADAPSGSTRYCTASLQKVALIGDEAST